MPSNEQTSSECQHEHISVGRAHLYAAWVGLATVLQGKRILMNKEVLI